MSYHCDSEDGNEAAFLMTNLEAGEVAAWCGACLPAFVDQLYASVHSQDLTDLDKPDAEPVPDVPVTDPVTGDETDDDAAADDPADIAAPTELASTVPDLATVAPF